MLRIIARLLDVDIVHLVLAVEAVATVGAARVVDQLWGLKGQRGSHRREQAGHLDCSLHF